MKTVRVTIEGGAVRNVECPKGVRVIVRDYDIDGVEPEYLQQDENDDDYLEYTEEHADGNV